MPHRNTRFANPYARQHERLDARMEAYGPAEPTPLCSLTDAERTDCSATEGSVVLHAHVSEDLCGVTAGLSIFGIGGKALAVGYGDDLAEALRDLADDIERQS